MWRAFQDAGDGAVLSGILSIGCCMNISTPPANPPWGWRCPGLGNTPPPPGDKKKFSGDVRSMNDSSSLTNTSSVSLIQSEHSTCGWQETCGQNRGGGCSSAGDHTPSTIDLEAGHHRQQCQLGEFLLMPLLDLQTVTISMSSLAPL